MTEVKYEIIDEIKCYSPELALNNTNFQSDGFEYLFNVEEKNFWFKSRNKIITNLFKKYFGTDQKKNMYISRLFQKSQDKRTLVNPNEHSELELNPIVNEIF